MNFIESVRIFLTADIKVMVTSYILKIKGLACTFQVFSFVFGDGDPNQGIEEERWKLVIIEH